MSGGQEEREALRSLWRELAEKGIEHGIDWPGIACELFRDLDRAKDEITAARTQLAAARIRPTDAEEARDE